MRLAWAAQPEQVALDGEREPGPVGTGAAGRDEGVEQRRTGTVGDVLEALDHVPEVAVGDGVEGVVGDLVAAQPGGQPPREAAGQGEFE